MDKNRVAEYLQSIGENLIKIASELADPEQPLPFMPCEICEDLFDSEELEEGMCGGCIDDLAERR